MSEQVEGGAAPGLEAIQIYQGLRKYAKTAEMIDMTKDDINPKVVCYGGGFRSLGFTPYSSAVSNQ